MTTARFYTQQELSTIFRCRPATVARWRRLGLLQGTRMGRCWLYDRDAVEAALARQGAQADAQAVEEVKG
jgi:hypothetical protein